jgi:acyl-CoA synthetase (AMP-forming)/AMP-acid ligase II
LFRGYLGRVQRSAEVFTHDGFLRTGDLAVEGSDGYYRIVGRLSDMFKSGGYNVYPREIELCLEQHPAVVGAAVVSIADHKFGEVGHAFVVLAEPGAPAGIDLRAWCRDHLANYKVPKEIDFLPAFPMLSVGKIDKAQLRQRARADAPASDGRGGERG